MIRFFNAPTRLLKSRSGATAIEYAIVAGCIALAIIGAVSEIGSKTNESFEAAEAGFN